MITRMTKGFTLVETLVAISVLTLSIVGPFQIAQNVLSTSYVARDQLIATALAQEGMEYTRAIRDSNFLYNIHNSGTRNWLYGLDGSTYGGVTSVDCYTNACTVDPGQQAIVSCGNSTCSGRPLYTTSTNLYTQTSTNNTVTKFTRKVQLTSLSSTETKVTITVSWTGHNAYSVVLTEIMRNWL
jgi:prepilin-type N-terminal cleavage/methylation domain-containing protein